MNATLERMTGKVLQGSTDTSCLILCGGGAQRLGGVDKPLEPWRDKPLIEHVLSCIPTECPVLISANRNLTRYRELGWPVFCDAHADGGSDAAMFQGPLAGIAAAAPHVKTQWLYVVPGDAPLLPLNLAAELRTACIAQKSPACCVQLDRRQPLPLLVATSALATLPEFLNEGGRAVGSWLQHLNAIALPRSDTAAFANFNTPEDFSR